MTRKIIYSILALSLFSSAALADHNVAIGIEGGIVNSKSKYNSEYNGEFGDYKSSDENTYKSFEISPFVGIMIGDLAEIRPGVTLGNYKSTEIEKQDDSLYDHSQYKAFSFGANVGGYFHLIRKDHFHLSMGPRFGWQMNGAPKREYDSAGVIVEETADDNYDNYSNNEFRISAPINLDFHIGKVFGIKLSFDMLALNIQKIKYKYKDMDTDYDRTNTNFLIMGSSMNIEGDNYPIGALLPKAALFVRF